MPIDLPTGVAWLRSTERGRAWLSVAPGLVEEAAEQWGLRLGVAFESAFESIAVPATTGDGRSVVLKVHFPDRENEHEADALARWNGGGAVQLIAHDRVRHALLLERCIPGSPLTGVDPNAALDVLIGLLPRLWIGAPQPFRPLTAEVEWWLGHLEHEWEQAGRPFERRLLDVALDAMPALAASQGKQVLLHQDLHGGNVLAAEREPWLAIDPKPLIGEREFAVAPIVRSFELGHTRRQTIRRLDRMTAELGLDRERARLWTIGQTVAWSVGSNFLTQHLETLDWLLDA